MDLQQKHLQHIAEMDALENVHKWYGWGSPIGLMIFFNGMAFFAILVIFAIHLAFNIK